MTGQQRACLRKLAQRIEPVIYIGKEGITQGIVASAKEAIEARELIKGSVQQNAEVSAKEACAALCEALDAQGISCIGRKFVLYKRSEQNILGF